MKMDHFMKEVNLLLDGKMVSEGFIDLRPMKPFCPRTYYNIAYIVCGIAFNEAGDVLMQQEAKEMCRGKWYLPAGRLEANETIVDAVKREVMEETCMKFEPSSLLQVLSDGVSYYRFTFIGTVTGKLKSITEADEESLQAAWLPLETILSQDKDYPLRGRDILPLLKLAKKRFDGVKRYAPLFPVIKAHLFNTLRMLLITPTDKGMEILTATEPTVHFPQIAMPYKLQKGGHACPITKLLTHIFGTLKEKVCLHGVLTIEHDGKPKHQHDGVCISVLVVLEDKNSAVLKEHSIYHWIPVCDPALLKKLRKRLRRGCVEYSM